MLLRSAPEVAIKVLASVAVRLQEDRPPNHELGIAAHTVQTVMASRCMTHRYK
jgi:hypothetical protein